MSDHRPSDALPSDPDWRRRCPWRIGMVADVTDGDWKGRKGSVESILEHEVRLELFADGRPLVWVKKALLNRDYSGVDPVSGVDHNEALNRSIAFQRAYGSPKCGHEEHHENGRGNVGWLEKCREPAVDGTDRCAKHAHRPTEAPTHDELATRAETAERRLEAAEAENRRLRRHLDGAAEHRRASELQARMSEIVNASLARRVRAFHERFGHPVASSPAVPSDEQVRFRLKLVAEEFHELLQASFPGAPSFEQSALRPTLERAAVEVDLPALVDAIADLSWVLEGFAAVLGVHMAPVYDEVSRANMSKDPVYVAAKDEHHRRPDPAAKPTKPAGWAPPDVAGVLREQGWKGA